MQNYKNHQVDLSNCDSGPIHIIGRIQPHGFLLIIDNATQVIEQASKNTHDFIGASPEDLLGKPIQALITPIEYAAIANLLQQLEPVYPQLLSWQGSLFFGFLHQSGNKWILEGEPYTSSSDQEQLKYTNLVNQLSFELNQMEDLKAAAETVAHALMGLLAYDRVEIIQFDPEWNSEVIAEAHSSRLPAYLGHHFPASDIPAPARDLLLKKHIRQIPNVDAQAVDVVPYYNPATGTPTNIIKSELRNPSEIHLEYVKNMGVAATISFSIITKGKLWGLISCHHVEPAFVNVWKRQVADLITKTLATVIMSQQEKRDVKQWTQFRRAEADIIKQIDQSKDIRQDLINGKINLVPITEGTGAALYIGKQLFTFRATPSKEQILDLIAWLAGSNTERMFCTQELSKSYPAASQYQEVASGLLALEISRYNQEYLLFFKPEIKATRIWAGNPERPVLGSGLQIHPRKSFEKWEEVVKGESKPWSLNEQEITQTLLKDIIAIQLRNQAATLENLNKELHQSAEALKTKNNQLEDFAHIMSHNLRSPLANIEGLHNTYQEEPNPEMAAFVMDHIKIVSDNMSHTINDLNVILKTRIHNQLPLEETNLRDLIEKEKQNLSYVIEQSQAEVQTDLQVSIIHFPKIYAESMLHNLISNALKYRSPHRKPHVLIRSWREEEQIFLSVSDNGLGMDLKKMGHQLFGLYQTFHRQENAKGLGLYLTKMQIEALGGKISVDSEIDKGTTFTVALNLIGD